MYYTFSFLSLLLCPKSHPALTVQEQLSLEQTVRAANDGAEPLAVTLDLDSGLASAESEAKKWLSVSRVIYQRKFRNLTSDYTESCR